LALMRGHLYEFGPYRLDPRERRLLKSGRPVRLTPKAFATLLVLVRNHGRLVDKGELIRAVWPDTFVEEIGLVRNISVLRKTLHHRSQAKRLIETVPRRGYRFVGDVRTILEPARPDPATTSIAVLPLKALEPQAHENYLGVGIADALITRLSTLRPLVVRPTNAVRAYCGHDPIASGRALAVEWVLDGCTQYDGDRLRVTAQLIRVRDGATVWAQTFDEALSDIFAVEDSISERVALAVMERLTETQRTHLAGRGTDNVEAHRFYLEGRYHWNKRTEDGFRKAIVCFNQALAADPNYAQAYAGVADAYTLLGSFSYGAFHPREVAQRARAAAKRALELDDRLAEPLTSLAFIAFRYDWDWAGAERNFKRAIALNPHYPTAHQWYAYCLSTMGRHDDALREILRAQELDPLSLPIATGIGRFLYFAGRYREALLACRKAVEMDAAFAGAHLDLGMIYEQLRRFDEAVSEFTQALELSGGSQLALVHLGHAYAVSGRLAEAERVLAELRELSNSSYVAPFDWAVLYAGFGDRARALACLEAAYAERSSSLVLLKVEPLLAVLKDEREFQDLLRRVGLSSPPAAS
jgi:DNA-binding winged helix-turn-helix (wHTH) protein/tetratricopeptide (TPR) repeat protein